jgi:PHD/YefM family antitoxin component YafN of YafNO toxin-antitoxin module
MIEIPLGDSQDQLQKLLQQAAADDVILTRDGQPVGAIIGFASEDDWFDYQLERDPRFVKHIKLAREQAAQGKKVRLEDL